MIIDLTGVAVAATGGVFSILTTVSLAVINARMKDRQAAAVLGAAVHNALGAMQQATDSAVVQAHPVVRIAGVPEQLTVGVQYVLDHAGAEAARAGVTPAAIADKVNAQLGLATMQRQVAS